MQELEQFLSDHMREVSNDRQMLTIFDPERRLLEVARSLTDEKSRLIEVDDDIITAREQAFEALVELRQDPSHSSSLVGY